ncbi:hypothetical protein [Paenibacillus wulumuqiensis]|uniref:hypothetical protein n=1 Tax=Paenibacillus wulumuqiensis TaxID=1567107 RepID=UPI000619479F|nr:hypothetical protein [Paenibacillus wulumuqiensis]
MKKQFITLVAATMLVLPMSGAVHAEEMNADTPTSLESVPPTQMIPPLHSGSSEITPQAQRAYISNSAITQRVIPFKVENNFGYLRASIYNGTNDTMTVRITKGADGTGELYASMNIGAKSQAVIPNYGKVAAGSNTYSISFSTSSGVIAGKVSVLGASIYEESN